MNTKKYTPRLIALELTRSCLSLCLHCRASAKNARYDNELTTANYINLLDNIASHYKPIIILTGGDPMLRKDVFDIAAYGTEKGLRMVMAPCGPLLDENKMQKLKQSGVQRLSFSLDGSNAEKHDNFRGVDGSFNTVLKAVEYAHQVGMPFQINSTVTKLNVDDLPCLLDLIIKLGAVSFHPFLLVPTGKAKSMASLELTPLEYENTLNWIYKQKLKHKIQIKPTCAPHFYRIYRQREQMVGRTVKPQTHGMDAMSKGCMGGQSFAFVSHTGIVQICGFLDLDCGNVKENNFNFHDVWENSKVFTEMRDLDSYLGKCGICGYRMYCGGCRARAYAKSGHYLQEEPLCLYQPKGLIDEYQKKH